MSSSSAKLKVDSTSEKGKTPIEYSIDIFDLSKKFRRKTLSGGGYSTLKSSLFGLFKKDDPATHSYLEAIKDIKIRVPKGSSVGIIGRNGSGKSTLLKLITGIYKPDSGTVNVSGRVSALIELGAGFHPDFSGRENLFLSGIMYGLTRKEIAGLFDTIVAFAELEDVIDDPVRTYSSGMFMRLGFSIAIHVDPDVLLVDEVLAVGDAGFVMKCKEKVSELRKTGKTLLLVSHDLDAVERWCDEVVWLDKGEIKDRGSPRRVIDHYRQYIEDGEEADLFLAQEKSDSLNESSESISQKESELEDGSTDPERWGGREVEIASVKLVDKSGESRLLFHTEDSLTIEIDYKMNEPQSDVVFGIAISRNDGLDVHGTNTLLERYELKDLKKEGKISYSIERLGLLEGHYLLDVAIHKEDGYPYDYQKPALEFKVRSEYSYLGVFEPIHKWSHK